MLGPTKAYGACSRRQKDHYLNNCWVVSNETDITLCTFIPAILWQKGTEGSKRRELQREGERWALWPDHEFQSWFWKKQVRTGPRDIAGNIRVGNPVAKSDTAFADLRIAATSPLPSLRAEDTWIDRPLSPKTTAR